MKSDKMKSIESEGQGAVRGAAPANHGARPADFRQGARSGDSLAEVRQRILRRLWGHFHPGACFRPGSDSEMPV